jgi:hypothetical protein
VSVRVGLLALCLVPSISAARASVAGEQKQGHDLIAQLQARTKACADLSDDVSITSAST